MLRKTEPHWKCACGATIPKHGAQLSGSPSSLHGLHIHCPSCSRTVAAHINPKEVQQTTLSILQEAVF